MAVLKIDAREITDWDSFHDVFARVFEFPDYYGRNMDAWIDCMTDVVDYSSNVVQTGEILTIHLEHSAEFCKHCSEILETLVDCVKFIKEQRNGLLALTFEA
jgi:RNAse (barnase) inhibitor barstar